MEINIHSHHTTPDDGPLQAEVEQTLRRFADWLTRVDVYLKDENAEKGGNDLRCTIEARPRGLDPVAAEAQASTPKDAVTGAVKKLQRQLEHIHGRRSDFRRG